MVDEPIIFIYSIINNMDGENARVYENLAFEGGGVKGLAYAGVIKYFEEHDMVKHVKRVIGSSAGCVPSILLAMKLNYEDIKKELLSIPFAELQDDSFGIIRDGNRFLTKYGIYKGDRLEEEVGRILQEYMGDSEMTFKQLFEKTGVELTVTASNVDYGRTDYFNHITQPDMKVKLAVRMSMSFPWAYSTVTYNGNRYADGGLYVNLAIEYWDNGPNRNPKTLGFALVGQEEIDGEKKYDTSDVIHYSVSIVEQLAHKASEGHYRHSAARLVEINTFDIGTLDFNITEDQKEDLIISGYNSCVEFFKNGKLLYDIDMEISESDDDTESSSPGGCCPLFDRMFNRRRN